MEMFGCTFTFRDGSTIRHLIQARTLGQARGMAQKAARAIGAVSFDLEG